MTKRLSRSMAWFLFLTILLCTQFSMVYAQSKLIIGFSLSTLREERWLKDQHFFMQRAKELGAFVNFEFANNESGLQMRQAENLILQGVNVLVVVPKDGNEANKIVEMAHEAGIKVIAYDRLIRNCNLDAYLSFDNVAVGELQAQGILKQVDRGDFAYIGGSPADNNAYLVKKGAMHVLKPYIASKAIRIVLDKFTNDWRPDEAYKSVKSYLAQGEGIDAIVCANDGTAGGAIQALKEFGMDGKVAVSGQDAELSACRRIVSGTQSVTVYKPIKSLAFKAAEVAVALAKGDDIHFNSSIDNGFKNVPAYLLSPVMVTKKNMQETVIKNRFHRHTDIYQ